MADMPSNTSAIARQGWTFMSKSREISLRAPRLRDLHVHMQRAAAGNDTFTRIVDAAYSERPRDAVDAEVRAIAAESMGSGPTTTSKSAGSKRRFDSGALCPDSIDLRVSLATKHRSSHRRCSHSLARVQILEDGEVVYEKPRPRVACLSLPSNGPTSRNFRNDMIQRGLESHFILYRALAEVPKRFHWRHELHQNAWSFEIALRGHESNLTPFALCATLRQCLSIGDFDGASVHAGVRLEQLLERRIEDRNELLEAARAMRDTKAAEVFQGTLSLPEHDDYVASLDRLFRPVAPNDLVFRGMFIALTVADTCAQGAILTAQPDAPTPEPADPRNWVLCNLANLQQSLLHDWEATLRDVRNLLVVLDAGNAQKLGALLSGPHESNWHAINAAALKVQRLIDEAQPDLDAMNGAVLECTRSIENCTESASHATAVFRARDAFAKSTQRVRASFEASAKELEEHLQVLERAQAQHTSRELDALIQFLADGAQVKRALRMRRLLSDLDRMREVADAGMREFLEAPRAAPSGRWRKQRRRAGTLRPKR